MVDRKLFLAILVTAIVVFGLTFAWVSGMYQGKLKALERAMYEKPAAITPANIKFSQTGGTEFNFTDTVAPDGSVATTTTKELAFDIMNYDTKTADVVISLVNPKTGEKGLPKELRNSYVDVYVKVDGKTKFLFLNNTFTNGEKITLDPATAISGSIGVTLRQAPAGTFADNQTYTITIYVIQPNADYVQSYTYTLKT